MTIRIDPLSIEELYGHLYHAKIPLQFWDDAFQTACYLINRLPTSTIKNLSPFEKLFNQAPDYNFLRIFGLASYAHLINDVSLFFDLFQTCYTLTEGEMVINLLTA